MTISSRLAVAPVVAFALSFAVVLAIGQLVVPIGGGDSGGSTATSPTPPTSTAAAEAGTIEVDHNSYTFGPVGPRENTFKGHGLCAQVEPLDGEQVQVCVATPEDATIPDWTRQPDGRWCAPFPSRSNVRITVEGAQ